MTSTGPDLEICAFDEKHREQVIALWRACGLLRPWNDPDADIDLAIATSSATVLVGLIGGDVAATALVGCDGHRGWIYYLAVDPEYQRRGFGRRMLEASEQWLADQGAKKTQLMIRSGNTAAIQFYDAQGYDRQDVVTYGKWLDGRRSGSAASSPESRTP